MDEKTRLPGCFILSPKLSFECCANLMCVVERRRVVPASQQTDDE